MNNPPNPAVTVTQADRVAAAQLYLAEEIISSGPQDRIGTNSPFDLARAEGMRAGEYDHWDIVQAFARHRQSIPVAAGVGEGLREALTPTDAQVEHVAKALYDAAHAGLSNCYAWDDAWEDYQEARRGRYYRDAKAAIPAVIAALAARPPEDLSTPDALLLGGDAMRGEGE